MLNKVELTTAQLTEIAEAVKDRATFTESGMHINYGDSEDRFEAFNRGHDDADNGKPCTPETDAPADEPYRQSWIDGYTEGWQFFMLQQIPWVPNLPAIARYLAEHPETVDALEVAAATARYMESVLPSSLPERRDAADVVKGLIAAMRGEGGE